MKTSLLSKHFKPFTVCNCQAKSENRYHFSPPQIILEVKTDLQSPRVSFQEPTWPGFSFPFLQVAPSPHTAGYWLPKMRCVFYLPWRHKVLLKTARELRALCEESLFPQALCYNTWLKTSQSTNCCWDRGHQYTFYWYIIYASLKMTSCSIKA